MYRATMWGAAPLLTLALLVVFSGPGAAGEEDLTAVAKAAWLGSCRKCHAVPDARFETDRAFLAQITETS